MQVAEVVVAQLELDQQRHDVLQPLLAGARLVDDLLPVRLGELAFLELHRVGAGGDGRVHELLRDGETAVVIQADLGNDVARLVGADAACADAQMAFPRAHVGSVRSQFRARLRMALLRWLGSVKVSTHGTASSGFCRETLLM